MFTWCLYSSIQMSATRSAFLLIAKLRSGMYGLWARSICAILEHGTISMLPPHVHTWAWTQFGVKAELKSRINNDTKRSRSHPNTELYVFSTINLHSCVQAADLTQKSSVCDQNSHQRRRSDGEKSVSDDYSAAQSSLYQSIPEFWLVKGSWRIFCILRVLTHSF